MLKPGSWSLIVELGSSYWIALYEFLTELRYAYVPTVTGFFTS